MRLINVLNIPAKYRKRYDKIKSVLISDILIEKTDSLVIFKGDTGYLTQIAFEKNSKILPNSEIKIDCECKSFMFEFAEAVNRVNGLLYPEKYIKKKSNKLLTPTGCKHLIFLTRYIYERSTIFERSL